MKIILSVCIAVFAAAPLFAQHEPFTAKIFVVKGMVEVLKANDADWVEIKAPYSLEAGDKVRTGEKSRADLYVKYGSKIRLGAESNFTLRSVSPSGNVVEMAAGRLNAWIRKHLSRKFEVRTPSAVCAVRGTEFQVVAGAGATDVHLFSGVLDVISAPPSALPPTSSVPPPGAQVVTLAPNQSVAAKPAAGISAPTPLPSSVKPESAPRAIAEEKVEIKVEKATVKALETVKTAQTRAEAAAAKLAAAAALAKEAEAAKAADGEKAKSLEAEAAKAAKEAKAAQAEAEKAIAAVETAKAEVAEAAQEVAQVHNAPVEMPVIPAAPTVEQIISASPAENTSPASVESVEAEPVEGSEPEPEPTDPVEVEPPPDTIIESQIVEESTEVSGSTP